MAAINLRNATHTHKPKYSSSKLRKIFTLLTSFVLAIGAFGAGIGVVYATVTISQNIQIGSGTPDLTLDGDDLYVTGTAEVDGTLAAKTGRAATFVVAASDASDRVKNQADYVVDGTADNVEIQAAIDALPAAGGRVVLSEGNFNVAAQINFATGVSLQGQGASTVLFLANNADVTVLRATGGVVSDVEIRDLKIDGNKANTAGDIHGIYFTNVTRGLIENVQITSCNGSGVRLDSSSQIRVVNSVVLSNDLRGIHTAATTDSVISGNHVASNGTFGIDIDFNTERVSVVGNTSRSNTSHGIFVEENAKDITVSGNVTSANSKHGLSVVSATNGRTTERITVQGNVIHANNEHGLLIGATTQAGAIVRDVSIVGNTITENDRNETNNNGILLTEVSGGTTENIIIVGNRIGDRHAIPTQNRAISITSGVSTVTISDNDFEDNVAAAAISDTGAVATIRNNRGFITESSGTATIPSAATSTTVTHGLAVTPAADDCSVTATNDLGTAAQFWTSGFGASNFTINVDTDPGASTATFAWTCQVL